ncbi:putative zinc-binding metallopeptidase [Flammeovirga sp. SubArs3]|uniref:putative zinc-binding metallopeptidase n=1 Tax=Flammeovirga sp. SubArs3 TaxID=2995316 RepID=UPI00248B935F|nr:putative zinc-binding metallopeptidase [Flammeovirga sp. SubArs3]
MKNLPQFLILLLLPLLQVHAQKKEIGKTLAVWEINNGSIKLDKGTVEDNKAKVYWEYMKKVLPNEFLDRYVVAFRLYTDGKEEDLGGMSPLDESNKNWQIELDYIDNDLTSNDSSMLEDMDHTIIHEFGHLLSLNIQQVEPTEDKYQDDERGYLTTEGYAKKDSYLGLYVAEFWKGDLLLEWDEIAMKGSRRRQKFLLGFYDNYQDQFINDYAVESPEEDFAESWSYFILNEKNEATSIKDKKINFFYQFPDLVAYRTEMRQHLKSLNMDD